MLQILDEKVERTEENIEQHIYTDYDELKKDLQG